jgi:hypothetical protein
MEIMSRHGLASLVVVSALSSTAFAQTGPDLLLGNFGEGQNALLRGDLFLMERGGTSNGGSARQEIYNVSGRMKLDFDDVIPGINRAQPRAGFQGTFIDFHTNDPSLPQQLTDVSVGAGMGLARGGKWMAGLSVAIGFASADAFDDDNALYGKADLAFGYTINERERIGVVLDYNGNRVFLPDVPLPGVQYSRVVNDQLTVQVGFPFSDITYKPDEKWTLLFRYLFPDGGEANIDYAITPALHVYAAFQQQNEAFHWDALADSNDRVLFSQSRVEVGVKGQYQDNLGFFVAAGYAFNTELEVGFDSRDTDELAELSDEPYVRVGVEMKF